MCDLYSWIVPHSSPLLPVLLDHGKWHPAFDSMLYWCKNNLTFCIRLIENFHLVDTRLEVVARVSFAVLEKLVFSDKQTLIVAECLVRIEGNIEGGQGQGVLADHEVLVVVDEDGVLHGVAEEQVDLVKVGT